MHTSTPDPRDRFVDDQRLPRVRARLADLEVDALIAFSPANSYYLTGCYAGMYSRPVVGIVTMTESVFVGPWLELHTANRTAWTDRVVVYEDADDPFDVLAGEVEECGIERAGIDEAEARSGWVRELAGRTDVSLADASTGFRELRVVKTDWEIRMMERARDLSRAGIDAFLTHVEAGVSELEVAEAMQHAYYRTYHEEYPAYDIGTANELGQYGFASVLTGTHALEPHSIAAARRIEDGHSVVAIALPSIQGYVCEQERTVLVGDVPPTITEAMEHLVEVRTRAMDMVGPSVPTDEIDAATTDRLTDAGYGEYLRHRTGHGQGITIHEPPVLNARQPGELQPGMLISIEPGLYFEDRGVALRHSDTLLVTHDGATRLTNAPDGVLTTD